MNDFCQHRSRRRWANVLMAVFTCGALALPAAAQWVPCSSGSPTCVTAANVGLGTTAPGQLLTLERFDGGTGLGAGGFLALRNTSAAINTKAGIYLTAMPAVGSGLSLLYTKLLNPANGASSLNFATYSGTSWNDPNMVIDSTGNVGIGGTPAADNMLDAFGQGAFGSQAERVYANSGRLSFNRDPVTGVASDSSKSGFDLWNNNGTMYVEHYDPTGAYVASSMQVGAGQVTLADDLLQIVANGAAEKFLSIFNTTNGGWYAGDTADGRFYLNAMTPGGAYQFPIMQQVSHATADIAFWGNVGVSGALSGTTAHFSGLVTGGTIQANYQDVAEWVPSGEELPAGTVVILDPEHDNQVRPSDHAYDTAVAGVVSAQPGIVLGESAATKSKIATTGRVRVKVDATRDAIKIGDLLVTSDVAGEAMKSEPIDFAGAKIHRPGTIIGKALEPLSSGQAQIMVLLSLQ